MSRDEVDLDLTTEDDTEPALPVYPIPVSAIVDAQARIDKANRRLERAGIDDRFTYELSEQYVREGDDGQGRLYQDLTLSHPSISYGGWEFTAAVDHTDVGPIVRSRPGVELDGWRPETSTCEHCGASRRRSATYLLSHEDGTRKQIGSSCMKDFLGVKPSGLWALGFDPLEESEDDEWIDRTSSADVATPSNDIIAVALAVTDGGRGFVSQSFAEASGRNPTSHAVRDQLFGGVGPMSDRERHAREQIAADAERYIADGTVDQVLQYARTMDGGGDYATNMRALATAEHVGPKHLGLLASAVSGWARENDRRSLEKAEAAAYTPGFLAEPKTKIAGHKAVVEKVMVMEGDYGPTTMLIMRAETGHTLKWNASGTKDLKAGDKIALTGGTVKDHGTYGGKDQTILTRVKYELDQD